MHISIFRILIFLLILLVPFSPAAADEDIPDQGLYQVDPNGDGNLNILDILKILEDLSDEKPQIESSDLNGNGRVDIFDLLKALQYLSDPPDPGYARLILSVKDPEYVYSSTGLHLATSPVEMPVRGAIYLDEAGQKTWYKNFNMDSTRLSSGELFWEKSIDIAGVLDIMVVIRKESEYVGGVTSFAGRSLDFSIKSGNTYQVGIYGFEKPFTIFPSIEKVSEQEIFVVWDSLPAAKYYNIYEHVDSLYYIRHEGVISPGIQVTEPGADVIYYTFFPVDYTGMTGSPTYYLFKLSENIFQQYNR